MSRNRIIYQSEALFVSNDASSTGVIDHEQLERVQSANYSFSISRQDINQYGQLSRIDSLTLEAPTVSLDFSYYLAEGFNEESLGFAASDDFSVGFASGHMTATSGKNLFILTSPEGVDAKDNVSAGNSVIGVGNAYLTDYTVDASVGSIPTVSVTMEAANVNADSNLGFDAGTSSFTGVSTPAIKQADGTKILSDVALPEVTTGESAITALRPGDVEISFGASTGTDARGPVANITDGADGSHVQSASLSLAMSRSPLERLGTKFPFARTVDFPVNATMSVSAIVNESTEANLVDIINAQGGFDIQMTFKDTQGNPRASYLLKNAKLDSESFSSSIGSNKTVDLEFSTQIGGPEDTVNNVLFSGFNSVVPFS